MAVLLTRRRALALLASGACALGSRALLADEAEVPARLQAELIAKVAAYDKNFSARAGSTARVLIVVDPGDPDSERFGAQLESELGAIDAVGGLPHVEERIPWKSADAVAKSVKQKHAAIVFFTPGFGGRAGAIADALSGADVLSVASVASYVKDRIVLGFDLVSGKPKLVVHLAQARRQNVAFKPGLLKLAKVYE